MSFPEPEEGNDHIVGEREFCGLIGVSPAMQRVYKQIAKVSRHDWPVLILGETGTGKELVARAIHAFGPRRDKAFVPVECSCLVPTLAESELFGSVRGAFTGAFQTRRGLVASADGGTLFLDEVGDIPLEIQPKLLRLLQEGEVRPVGATHHTSVNTRVIAATHRDVGAAVRDGRFRQDLYYRLNVVQICLPPLRARKGDIPLLARTFLKEFPHIRGTPHDISEDAMQSLLAHDWPGNVRELRNAILHAVAMATGGDVLRAIDFFPYLQPSTDGDQTDGSCLVPLKELERRAIFHALRETGGDKVAAARLLGIGKTTLYRKLKEYRSAKEG